MFENLRNSFDFFIRSKTKFSRKNFVEKNPELIDRNRQENLYTQDILERYFSKLYKQTLTALDIGCKNWFYAKGEYEFLKSFSENFILDGIEIDAYRLYSNFYNRFEVAKYYTKGLKNTNYIADNLLNLNKKYDYIFWFLPFILIEPHLYWGLPKKHFNPKKLLKHAYSLLNNGGEMLIINQGKEEAKVQERFLKELNIKFTPLGEITSKHFKYQNKRYGYLIKK